MCKEPDKRKLRHLGLIGPRIPCATNGCEFFQVKLNLCTNCYASSRRKRPGVASMEKENKKRYLAKPGKAEQVAARKRENCRSTGYYQRAEYKEKKKAYYTSERGRALYAARTAKRRAVKVSATPEWLTEHSKRIIKRIYEIAGAVGCHVDHIVPLKGKNVTGLHVPWNLSIKNPASNLAKGNRLDQEELARLWQLRKLILES